MDRQQLDEFMVRSKQRLSTLTRRSFDHLKIHQQRYLVYSLTIIGYLLLSWLFTLLLDPYHHLVTRMILFILGLIPLAILVRWDDNRIVMGFAFLLFNLLALTHTLWFPVFYAAITPLFPIFFNYQQFLPHVAAYNQTGQLLLRISRFGYLVDLAIVLTLAGMISLSSQLVDHVFEIHGRRRVLESLAIVILLVTLILLPYLVMLSTGVLHFGLAYGSGATQLQFGLEELQNSGNISQAYPFFEESARQYRLAEDLFSGLDNLGLDRLLLLFDPTLSPLIDNGELLIESSFFLSELFLPLLDGLLLVESGFSTVTTDTLNRSLLEQTSYLLSQSRSSFDTAQLRLFLALAVMEEIDLVSFNDALQDNNIGDYQRELDLMRFSGLLFNTTMDLLLLHLAPLDTYSFPLNHALEVIYHTRLAQQQIGNTTRYGAVIPTFEALQSNLTVVERSLDTERFSQYDHLSEMGLGGLPELRNARTQIAGLFNFLRDLTGIGVELSEFGINVANTLQLINSSLLPLSSDIVNFPNIPSSTLLAASSILQQVRSNATILQDQARSIEARVDAMDRQASEGSYGIFRVQAQQVIDILQSFHLSQNADNFYHLSSACYYLVLAIFELQYFDRYISRIEGNLTRMENNPGDDVIIEESVDHINSTLQAARVSVQHVQANLTLVEFHLTRIENMPEKDTLLGILADLKQQLDQLAALQTGALDRLDDLLSELATSFDSELVSKMRDELVRIEQALDRMDTILERINIPAGSQATG